MLRSKLLFDTIQRAELPNKFPRIFVAYSGGLDSHALLHLASQTFPNVHAIHINHKIDAHDDLYQAHCQAVCAQMQIPLQCVAVDLKEFASQSMELSARNARRRAWQQNLGEDDLLLLAHHADDQAETILYRFLRGSGPRGLIGMQATSKLGVITLMRPLLTITKNDILEYALENKLQWINDHSNTDLSSDRNFLRQSIVPLLQSRWPQLQKNVVRNGSICAQLLQNLDPQLKNDLQHMVGADASLDIQKLSTYQLYWQTELLRAWLLQHDIVPTARHVRLILQEVIAARIDAMPELQIANKFIKRAKNKLFVVATNELIAQEYCLSWNLDTHIELPDGRRVIAAEVFNTQQQIDKLQACAVTVRQGLIGRKAKKVFQQNSIPPWERHKFPLVFADDRLVGIVGLWTSPRL